MSLEKKILVIAVRPIGSSDFNVKSLIDAINEGEQEARLANKDAGKKYELLYRSKTVQGYSFSEFNNLIDSYKPNIVHLIGHGSDSGRFVFQDKEGRAEKIDNELLINKIRYIKDDLECVILSACYSKDLGKSMTNNGIKYVFAKEGELDVEMLKMWIKDFYRLINSAETIEGINMWMQHHYNNYKTQFPQLIEGSISSRIIVKKKYGSKSNGSGFEKDLYFSFIKYGEKLQSQLRRYILDDVENLKPIIFIGSSQRIPSVFKRTESRKFTWIVEHIFPFCLPKDNKMKPVLLGYLSTYLNPTEYHLFDNLRRELDVSDEELINVHKENIEKVKNAIAKALMEKIKNQQKIVIVLYIDEKSFVDDNGLTAFVKHYHEVIGKIQQTISIIQQSSSITYSLPYLLILHEVATDFNVVENYGFNQHQIFSIFVPDIGDIGLELLFNDQLFIDHSDRCKDLRKDYLADPKQWYQMKYQETLFQKFVSTLCPSLTFHAFLEQNGKPNYQQ